MTISLAGGEPFGSGHLGVLTQPEIDAGDLAASNSRHTRSARQGLRAGEPVIIKGPMADSLTDSERFLCTQKKTCLATRNVGIGTKGLRCLPARSACSHSSRTITDTFAFPAQARMACRPARRDEME